MNRLDSVEKTQLRSNIPDFQPGDTVRVHVRIKESETKERLQAFEGVVIARKHGGSRETITVRKTSFGVGVERIFPLHATIVDHIDVVKRGHVRRAKLYYLRELRGKAARIRERDTRQTGAAAATAAVASPPPAAENSGDTGVALLSRLPLRDVTRIDLPWQECQWRPRLAIAATITVGTQDVRIFNAHVDPHAAVDGQLAQLEAIATQTEATTLPTIVLGDFNTLSRQKCIETREFLEARGYTTPFPTGTATWRTTVLKMHADWIFVRGVKIKRWGVAKPLNVSDHWPIWAEVVVE